MDGKLLLVGGGKMGGAMLAGWLARGISPGQVVVVEPDEGRAADLVATHGVTVVDVAHALDEALAPTVVVIAVKPQVMDDVVPGYRRFATSSCVFLSIAAGTRIGYFERRLGPGAAIVRAMPNTPAAVGRAMTVGCPNGAVTDAQRTLCDDLLSAIGQVAWIDDEGLMDAVTGLSGSGPAYVFLLAETLAEAGEAAGLPPELAARLARATVAGAGELLHQSPEAASTLRANVTSPGGTTAEALEVLMGGDGWREVVIRAVGAATMRSKELSG